MELNLKVNPFKTVSNYSHIPWTVPSSNIVKFHTTFYLQVCIFYTMKDFAGKLLKIRKWISKKVEWITCIINFTLLKSGNKDEKCGGTFFFSWILSCFFFLAWWCVKQSLVKNWGFIYFCLFHILVKYFWKCCKYYKQNSKGWSQLKQ